MSKDAHEWLYSVCVCCTVCTCMTERRVNLGKKKVVVLPVRPTVFWQNYLSENKSDWASTGIRIFCVLIWKLNMGSLKSVTLISWYPPTFEPSGRTINFFVRPLKYSLMNLPNIFNIWEGFVLLSTFCTTLSQHVMYVDSMTEPPVICRWRIMVIPRACPGGISQPLRSDSPKP